MIKRRGKLGLIAVNKNLEEVKKWTNERMGKDQKVGNAVGKLRKFIIEPFIPHKDVSLFSLMSKFDFFKWFINICQNSLGFSHLRLIITVIICHYEPYLIALRDVS